MTPRARPDGWWLDERSLPRQWRSDPEGGVEHLRFHANPTLQQLSYRGRNDNGTETTATWKANINTGWTQAVDENFRVRFEVQETGGAADANTSWRLQYNLNGAGWNDVTDTSNVVRSSASPNVADGVATTNQLANGSGTFVAASIDEVDGLASGTAIGASGHTEPEWCVQVRSADTVASDSIQLRVVTGGGTALATYTNTPTLALSFPAVTHQGAAVLTADSSLAAAGEAVRNAAAALTGDSSLAAVGALDVGGAAALTGDSSITAAGNVEYPVSSFEVPYRLGVSPATTVHEAAASLVGDSSLAAAGVATVSGAAPLTDAEASLAATASAGLAGEAAPVADSSLAATAALTATGNASLVGDASLAAQAVGAVPGAAVLAGDSSLAASAGLTSPAAAGLNSDSSLGATAALTAGGAASLVGDGSLVGTGSYLLMGAAVLTGDGSLVALGGMNLAGAAALTDAVSSLVGSGGLSVGGAALLVGEASIAADGTTHYDVGVVLISPTPPYRVVIAEINGPELEEVPFKNLQMSWALNEPGGIGFTLPLEHPKTTRDLLDPGKREIHVYRHGVRIWGGYLWTASPSSSDVNVRFSGEGYLSRLLRRYLDVDKDYDNLDQFQIAWNLINFTQNKVIDGVSGELGIVRDNPAEASGVMRDRHYRAWNRPNIGALLQGFTELNDGFDFDITPMRRWRAFYPQKGADLDIVFELGKNIGTIAYDIDASQTVSEVTGLGAGDRAQRCIVVASNSAALTEFGILQKSVDFSNIKKFGTLEERTIQELRKYKRARMQPQITVITDDPPFGSYDVGDRAWVRADKGFMDVNKYLSIVNMLVQVSDEGRESTQLFFDEVLV